MMLGPDDVLAFWFNESRPEDWFSGDPAFDARLTARFADLQASVHKGEAYGWRGTPDGRLAEIIVLDQFSRQIFRGQARAFASDPMALALAQEAVAQGLDHRLEPVRRGFLYMPYMHSESLAIHEEAMRLFTALGGENLPYEIEHRDTLLRFGRYPARNAALGRESTDEEKAFLAEKG